MPYSRVLPLIFIGWYLVLAAGHYFNQRPLWNDEQCVVINLNQLKPAQIFTQPLLNDQDFPRAYLWAIQQFSNFFHQSLLSLRLFSFMAMLGAFFVWLHIARRVLTLDNDFALYTGCWCASMPLVYYAAELKPYSMDVLALGLITLFLMKPPQHRVLRWFVLLLLPMLGLWSYAAIFLLSLPLYNLVRESLQQRRWLPELGAYLGSYALMLGIVYMFDFRVTIPHLFENCWHDYFILFDSFRHFFDSFGKGMNNVIGRRFAESPRWVKGPSRIFIGMGILYMLLAFWADFKKDRYVLRSIVPIAFGVFLLQLVLAVLHVFPLGVPRMSLFFTPPLILMTVMGLRWMFKKNRLLGSFCQLIFAAYLIFVSLGIASNVFIKGNLGAEATLYSVR